MKKAKGILLLVIIFTMSFPMLSLANQKSRMPIIVKENESITINGVANKNKVYIYKDCIFEIKENQTFYIQYNDNVNGKFQVGIVDSDGNEIKAQDVLCSEDGITSVKITKGGKYYFYIKGTNDNAGWFTTNFNFICYFK